MSQAETPAKKIKVLVIAEAANPEWTSVPLVGWSHNLALSKICDVHLATHIRNKDAIERWGWRNGVEFTAIDSEKVAAPLYKLATKIRGGNNLGWTIDTALSSIAYPYFEYLCWQTFKGQLAAGDFDIVHRITPVSPTAPSYLAKKLKKIAVPFIVGPLNGGVDWPREFKDLQHKEKEWLSYVRNAYKLLPGYHALRKYSSVIIAGSMATKYQLAKKYQHKTLYLPENAIDPARFNLRNTSSYNTPLKAAFVGRLVPYKGADMAIEAMVALVHKGKITYDIYGSGPEEERLRRLVKEKKLDDKVIVHGFIPNTQLQAKLVEADIFVFPSVREFGGGVVLEAMALGVVPVVANYAGPAELITPQTGYCVPMGGRQQFIEGFRQQLEEICADPSVLANKRHAAIERVNNFYTWEKKSLQILSVYNGILGRAALPEFQTPFP